MASNFLRLVQFFLLLAIVIAGDPDITTDFVVPTNYSVGAINPPHTHPRSAELLLGLVHYQSNDDPKQPSVAVSAFTPSPVPPTTKLQSPNPSICLLITVNHSHRRQRTAPTSNDHHNHLVTRGAPVPPKLNYKPRRPKTTTTVELVHRRFKSSILSYSTTSSPPPVQQGNASSNSVDLSLKLSQFNVCRLLPTEASVAVV
ncbi:hypothetical protein Patl1_05217 [Pistacia atlantica]|uniref:Uncharacterized protein n=1 Tax=Pistacia atlantica TaxID=434234 RepID=A0ACC1BTN7_9ROSI|nr:hypothetical protein Patl1_05217 [Pistacia atlantica]